MIAALAFLSAFVLRLSSLSPSITSSNAELFSQIHSWRWMDAPWSSGLFPLLKSFSFIFPAGNYAFRAALFPAVLSGLTALVLIPVFNALFPAPNSTQMFVHMEDTRWQKACSWISSIALVSVAPIAGIFLTPDNGALMVFLLAAALASVLNPFHARQSGRIVERFAAMELAFVVGFGMGTGFYFICFVPGLLDLAFASRTERAAILKQRALLKEVISYGGLALAAGFLLARPTAIPSVLHIGSSTQNLADYFLPMAEGFSVLRKTALSAIHSLSHGFTPIGLLLCLWGVYSLQKRSEEYSRAFGLLIFGALVSLPWTSASAENSLRGSFGPAALALFFGILAAYGIHDLGVRFFKRRGLVLMVLVTSLCFGLSQWERKNLMAWDFGWNVFRSLPENAALFPESRPLRDVVSHLQTVPRLRPDVRIEQIDAYLEEQLTAMSNESTDRLLFFEPGRTAVPESDSLPYGLVSLYFPSHSHRLLNPPSQISLLRHIFWWYRKSAPWDLNFYGNDMDTSRIAQRYVDAHLALAAKSREYGLEEGFHLENLAALSLSPHNYRALKDLGQEALEKGQYNRAAFLLRSALKENTSDAALYFQAGSALRGAGHYKEALPFFETAVASMPESREAREALAETQDDQRRYEEAQAQWKWLMDQNPQDKTAVWRLIQDYHLTGKEEKAKELLQEYFLLSLTPEEKSRAEIFHDALAVKMTP